MAADLVAYLPCPVKVPFEQALNEYRSTLGEPSLSVQIEGNANQTEADYNGFLKAASTDELPALLITPGVNQLYGRSFLERVVDSGAYADAAHYPYDPRRRESALRDPAGHATVLAANVTVMVVDRLRLGARSAPRAWRDLLAPEFSGSVIMRGNGRTFCETTLLAWYQLWGADGLRHMGRSVSEGWHPAQMAKAAGSGCASSGAAVYVMPYFFARNIRNFERVSLVWPEEGAIASPVTLLAKKVLPDHLRAMAEFLTGPVIARLFAHAGLPTPHPDVGSGVSESIRYLLPGWSVARSTDLSAELARAEAAFAAGHGGTGRPAGAAVSE